MNHFRQGWLNVLPPANFWAMLFLPIFMRAEFNAQDVIIHNTGTLEVDDWGFLAAMLVLVASLRGVRHAKKSRTGNPQ